MATYCSILVWEIPWTEKSMGSQELDTTEHIHTHRLRWGQRGRTPPSPGWGRGRALSLCHLRTVRRQQAVWKQRREPLPELHHAGTLVSDFQAPKRWGNKYLLFRLPGLWELSRSWWRYHIFSLVVILREQEFNSFPRGIWLSLDLLRKYVYRTGMPQTLSQELKTPISSS